MIRISISQLCDRYVEHLLAAAPSKASPVRSNLRRLRRSVDPSEEAGTLLIHVEERLGALTGTIPGPSLRAIRSHLMGAFRWALAERLIVVPPECAAHLGLLSTDRFAGWRDAPRALTIYKLLLTDAAIGGTRIEDIDEEYLTQFLEQLPSRITDWRSCWSAFSKQWGLLADDGVLPELELPQPPSNRPADYAARESELPTGLQCELRTATTRLRGESIAERAGSAPLDDSTTDLVVGAVLRLLGYLENVHGLDMATMSLAEALRLENARAFVEFTSERYYARLGSPPERDAAGRMVIGEYQLSILRQLAAVVRLGLRDEQLHAEYAEEIRFSAVGVRNRREQRKSPGVVDDYYRVAATLTERALDLVSQRGMTPTTAIAIRDALIFALLAAHGYRRSVLAMLDLKKNIRMSADGVITLCVPREQTKPGIRDQQLELPQELHGLWRMHLEQARPALLSGKRSSALFIAQGGRALRDDAIYAVVVSRSEGILGVRHNPHQARKALATDYGLWSSGDYLSASAVLDSSPLTLQRHYADLRREERIASFDAATSGDWHKAIGGNAA